MRANKRQTGANAFIFGSTQVAVLRFYTRILLALGRLLWPYTVSPICNPGLYTVKLGIFSMYLVFCYDAGSLGNVF